MNVDIESALIEITDLCNLHCKYCYNGSSNCGSMMSLTQCRDIIQKLAKLNVKTILISGGEPFLHPNVMEIIKIARSSCDEVLCITNGTLLTFDIMDYILLNSGISIQLSLDGATEGTDDAIRGKGHFSKAINIMEYLSERGYKHGKARITINSSNIDELEHFLRLCQKYNFEPMVQAVVPIGRAKESWGQMELSIPEKIRLNSAINRISKSEDIKHKSIECSIGKNIPLLELLIKINGDIQPCHLLYDKQFKIGSIYLENLIDEERLNKLILKVRERKNNTSVDRCRSCPIVDKCNKGCPAKAFYTVGFNGIDEDSCLKRVNILFKNINDAAINKLLAGEL